MFARLNASAILVIIMVLLLCGGGIYMHRLISENKQLKFDSLTSENNHIALVDSIHNHYNKKTKEYESEKRALVMKRDDLLRDSTKLSREVSKLSKNVQYYTSLVSKLQGKIGELESKLAYNDSVITVKWDSETKEKGFEQILEGETIIDYYVDDDKKLKISSETTKLIKNSLSLSLSFRQESVKRDGKEAWKVIVSSPTNRFKIDEMSSVYFIDKQTLPPSKGKSPWTFGPSISYGVNGDGKLGLNVGISLQYNLLHLFNP